MDVKKIREDFPVLNQSSKKQLIYFDSACTTLKPMQVIKSINDYYSIYGACAGRSTHALSVRSTDEFENARENVKKFINAKNSNEIIWTKNATEAINLVVKGFGFKQNDTVLTTNLEHSSELLPWQDLSKQSKINLDFVLCNKEGEFDIEDFKHKITKKTKMVSVIFTSNVTATTSPIREITKIAHENGALVLADAAQAVPHIPIDVRKLDIDFLAFSGHKMCGPTGIGCLYGKEHLLKELSPLIVGGGTITDADLHSHKLDSLPNRLEGGIQDYAGAIGLGAAIDYLKKIGMDNISKYEIALSKKLIERLSNVRNLDLIGPKDWNLRNPLASFTIKGMQPHDIAGFMDHHNIAIRSGMLCAYPFHKYINQHKGSARASLYFYNTIEEIDRFVEKLDETVNILV